MSEEKFTLGPWFIKQSEEIRSPYSTNVSSTRITILDTPGGQYQSRHVIAQVAKGNGRGDANAALIAAAPEMYRKLEWLQREFDESDDEELVAIGWEIELILKKARGER